MSDPFLHIHTNICIISVTLNVSRPSGYFLEDQEQTSCSETSMCVHVCEKRQLTYILNILSEWVVTLGWLYSSVHYVKHNNMSQT